MINIPNSVLVVKSFFFVLSLFALFLLTLLQPAVARPVRMWYPDELTQKADLVVVATIKSTGDAHPPDFSKARADTWIPVESVFEIQSVLKGHLLGKTVTIFHYRYFNKSAEISVVDGPEFVAFDPTKKNQYLIYLKRGAGISYEPLSGQEDPGLSFSRLQPYSPSQERP